MDKDPLQRWFYFISFTNSLKIVLLPFSETYMLLMYHQSIRGEEIPYDAKISTWNLLHAYIDAHSQRLLYECPVDGVQAISISQSQCVNMNFSDQSI